MNRLKKFGDNLKNKVGVTGRYTDKIAIIEGWLTKRATKSAKRWNLRYFVLYDDALVYYADSDTEYPRGEIKLGESFFVSDSSMMKFAFQASDLDNTYYLAADTLDEKLFWLHNISQVIRRMDNGGQPPAAEDVAVYEELELRVSEYSTFRASTTRSSVLDKPDEASFLQPPPGVVVSTNGRRSPQPAPRPVPCSDQLTCPLRETMTPIPKISDLISSLQQSTSNGKKDTAYSSVSATTRSRGKKHERAAGAEVVSKKPQPISSAESRFQAATGPVAAPAASPSLAQSPPPAATTRAQAELEQQHLQRLLDQQSSSKGRSALTADAEGNGRSGFEVYWDMTSSREVDGVEECSVRRGPGHSASRSPSPSPPPRTNRQSAAKAVAFKPPLRSITPPSGLRPTGLKQTPPEDNRQEPDPRCASKEQTLSSEIATSPDPLTHTTDSVCPAAACTPSTVDKSASVLVLGVVSPPSTVPSPPNRSSDPPPVSLSPPPVPTRELSPASPSVSPTPGSFNKGGVSNAAQMWQQRVQNHQEGQSANPFSSAGGTKPHPLRPGDEGYGKAPEGSLTAVRAASAADWVLREIEKLCEVIRKIGREMDHPIGEVRVCFGELFYAYQDISDTLVGIMMRAKKRKIISYPGDMLFQGCHDKVEIVLFAGVI